MPWSARARRLVFNLSGELNGPFKLGFLVVSDLNPEPYATRRRVLSEVSGNWRRTITVVISVSTHNPRDHLVSVNSGVKGPASDLAAVVKL